MRNFGYLKPSRVFNVETFRHKQQDDLYINFERNMYYTEDHKTIVSSIVSGKPILTSNRVDKIYVEDLKKRNVEREKETVRRARKAKKRI